MRLFISIFSFSLLFSTAFASSESFLCTSKALQMAKSIRLVEMPTLAKNAQFRIVRKNLVSQEFATEVYLIEMSVKDKDNQTTWPMTDQQLEVQHGGSCILVSYTMPKAS